MTIYNLRKRGPLQITFDILTCAREGTRKTPIMFECKISYELLDIYLKLLLKRGLLEKEGKIFRTTDRGKLFIEKYLEIRDLTEPLKPKGEDEQNSFRV